MRNEKPGGHGERSVAVGVLDMRVGCRGKDRRAAAFPVTRRSLSGGLFDDRVFVYAAGGYYYPDKDLSALQNEMRGYLDLGYSTMKMKIGGAPLSEDLRRIEAVLKILENSDQLAVDANGRFDLETAVAYARALAPYGLRWYEEQVIAGLSAASQARGSLSRSNGDGRESLFTARRTKSHTLRATAADREHLTVRLRIGAMDWSSTCEYWAC